MVLRALLGASALIAIMASGVHAEPLDHVLATIAAGETGNDPDAYTALYGGGHFRRFGFPEWPGKMGPAGITHAAGKCQFQPGTWVRAAQAYIVAENPVPDFNNPVDQDAVCKFWASVIYQKNTGRSLAADAELGRVEWKALSDEWTSLRSKSSVVKKVEKPARPKPEPAAKEADSGRCWDVFAKNCTTTRHWDVFAKN
jgi:muramidase (phage lysozyme)